MPLACDASCPFARMFPLGIVAHAYVVRFHQHNFPSKLIRKRLTGSRGRSCLALSIAAGHKFTLVMCS